MTYFRIHGDNIVECERTLRIIGKAFAPYGAVLLGPMGNPTNPQFRLQVDEIGETFDFIFFPGFGRWNYDIRDVIRELGGSIRESADSIVTELRDGYEEPLVGIEFSAALSAGNQAWQRSGRAYSFGEAGIPYLYVAEVGGVELDRHRVRRSPRFPNPAVPFSYLSYSSDIDVPVLPIFLASPGIDSDARTHFIDIFGEDDLCGFMRRLILGSDTSSIIDSITEKTITFVQLLAARSRGRYTLEPDRWRSLYDEIKVNQDNVLIPHILQHAENRWSKTAYISSLTDSARDLMLIASKLGVGVTSTRLPICLMGIDARRAFATILEDIYPDLTDEFKHWNMRREPLVICWVMGFKPRGDDARPDRGLPPLTRMLAGSRTDMLTIVYGPAPLNHWDQLVDNPQNLARTNGLWEAILNTTDAILVDSATDTVTHHGFVNTHWDQPQNHELASRTLVNPTPIQVGENDVDTIVHTVLGRMGGSDVFEGLCNPPGGDWSGISLLTQDRAVEIRWLSLPRVSGSQAKRPDHVFQIFGLSNPPIILAIESKANVSSIEPEIGDKLKSYMTYLMSHPASAQRNNQPDSFWRPTGVTLSECDYILASAGAALIQNPDDLTRMRIKAGTDIVLGLEFNSDQRSCTIHLQASTDIGKSITDFMVRIQVTDLTLRIVDS